MTKIEMSEIALFISLEIAKVFLILSSDAEQIQCRICVLSEILGS
jgi:hypothetical protein